MLPFPGISHFPLISRKTARAEFSLHVFLSDRRCTETTKTIKPFHAKNLIRMPLPLYCSKKKERTTPRCSSLAPLICAEQFCKKRAYVAGDRLLFFPSAESLPIPSPLNHYALLIFLPSLHHF